MLCAKHAFQGMGVQMCVGQQPFELTVLQVQLKQPFPLAGIHATVLGAPLVKRGVADAVLTPNLLGRNHGLCLPLKANDLLFAEFTCFHVHHSLGRSTSRRMTADMWGGGQMHVQHLVCWFVL